MGLFWDILKVPYDNTETCKSSTAKTNCKNVSKWKQHKLKRTWIVIKDLTQIQYHYIKMMGLFWDTLTVLKIGKILWILIKFCTNLLFESRFGTFENLNRGPECSKI